MASLDQVSIAILLGAVLVMAGILSSLLALRFGAPLLLVFLLIGMLAGDAGPGRLAESNAQQVTKARQIIEGLGLEIASSDEAREILSLKGGDKVDF